ncbi:MAG TPA: hypothetical protein VF843_06235 [Streptosporangiaceae bacterium]
MTEPALLPRLGWQFVPPETGQEPPLARPVLEAADQFDPGWQHAQTRISRSASRPALAGFAAGLLVAGLGAATLVAGTALQALGGTAVLAGTAGAVAGGRSAWRERRRLDVAIAAERERADAAAASASATLAELQREHAAEVRAWQRRRRVAGRRPAWLEVSLPGGLDRVDVAGGTMAGWSALVTTVAAPLLGAGGEVSVIDLTEAAVAADLASIAGRAGLRPLVWTLPADLPSLDLGPGLAAGDLADVLALAAAAASASHPGPAAEAHGADPAPDVALLERVIAALRPGPPVASVTAALRALAGVGDPRDDVRAGWLSPDELDRVGRLFGRGAADRIVTDRAYQLESRLRWLDALGTGPPPAPRPPVRLRIAALDRRSGMTGNRMLGTYLVAALTHLLRQAEPGDPWAHTICVLGAERLAGDLLDRLTDACSVTRTGLVLAFRSVPPPVRERLGRGSSALAFMRLGNTDEAKAASELIGTEHRFVVGQITDTEGASVTDTWGGSYTSTAGTADSYAESLSVSRTAGGSRGRGRSGPGGFAPFGGFSASASRDSSYSAGDSTSVSLTEGINTGTSWGISLSRAAGVNSSLGTTVQRSRELLVEAEELQRLPPTAMIVSFTGDGGRTVLLADANPAIGLLPEASG